MRGDMRSIRVCFAESMRRSTDSLRDTKMKVVYRDRDRPILHRLVPRDGRRENEEQNTGKRLCQGKDGLTPWYHGLIPRKDRGLKVWRREKVFTGMIMGGAAVTAMGGNEVHADQKIHAGGKRRNNAGEK